MQVSKTTMKRRMKDPEQAYVARSDDPVIYWEAFAALILFHCQHVNSVSLDSGHSGYWQPLDDIPYFWWGHVVPMAGYREYLHDPSTFLRQHQVARDLEREYTHFDSCHVLQHGNT
jgi:hypothetical protein